jgi:hypothetical protein
LGFVGAGIGIRGIFDARFEAAFADGLPIEFDPQATAVGGLLTADQALSQAAQHAGVAVPDR